MGLIQGDHSRLIEVAALYRQQIQHLYERKFGTLKTGRLIQGCYIQVRPYYMRNFCDLIGLEQWYFSLI